MKKFALLLIAAAMPIGAFADAIVDDITARYGVSLEQARASCAGLSDKIDSVKVMAGISVAGGAVGTIGGAAGAATGAMKATSDGKLKEMGDDPAARIVRAETLLKKVDEDKYTADEAAEIVALTKWIGDNKDKFAQIATDRQNAHDMSQTLGNVRAAGSFVGAAGGAAGAAGSLAGAKTLDDLIADMEACEARRAEIEKQRMELRMADADNPALARMDKIAEDCRGLNAKNISDIKTKMTAGGVISIVGAAAGAAGGIVSIAANKTDANAANHGGMNTAATALSGVSGIANLGGAILGGAAMSGLMKNGEVATKCKDAFQM